MFYYPVEDNIKLKLLEKHHANDLYNLIENNRTFLEKWVDCVKDLKSVSDCERFIAKTLTKYSHGLEIHMGVWSENILVGCICVINIDSIIKKAELGYFQGENHQGKGYITKSLKAVKDNLIENRGFIRIEINVSSENKKSIEVARRLGFSLEGKKLKGEFINNEYHDVLMYAVVQLDNAQTKM